MKLSFLLILFVLSVNVLATDYLLVANIGTKKWSKRGYLGSAMEQFNSLAKCKMAGKIYKDNALKAMNISYADYIHVECVNMESEVSTVLYTKK